MLTVSDAGAAGKRADASGDAIVAWVERRGWTVSVREVVPDESDLIARWLVRWADDDAADLILTTGGTGLGPRDVTPEATRASIERDAPGIAEALRAAGARDTPRSWLSRGVAGVRAESLIVNLPGSPSGVQDGLAVLEDLAEHAVEIVRGRPTDHR